MSNTPRNITFLVGVRGGYKTTYLSMLRQLAGTLHVSNRTINWVKEELAGRRNLTVLIDEPLAIVSFEDWCMLASSVEVSGIKFLLAITHSEYATIMGNPA